MLERINAAVRVLPGEKLSNIRCHISLETNK